MWGGERDRLADGIGALLDWWREAGVTDYVQDEPVNWLAIADDREAQQGTRPAGQPTAPGSRQDAAASPARRPAASELVWSGPEVPQRLIPGAPLVVVLDMPDSEAPDGEPLTGVHTALLDAMLRAIGLRLADSSLALLSPRRPAGGLLDEPALATLGGEIRQTLALGESRAALLLGDRTARALLATDSAGASSPLQLVNHDKGTLPAIALPHLGLIANRPKAKARCWHMLRHLHGIVN